MKKSKHHRKPRANGGRNHKRNISYVPDHQHSAFHTLFGTKNVYEIAQELNEHWIDPDFKFIVKPS